MRERVAASHVREECAVMHINDVSVWGKYICVEI